MYVAVSENYYFYFSTKTYVVQCKYSKEPSFVFWCSNETVLLSTKKHMFKLMGKKIIATLCTNVFLNWINIYVNINQYMTKLSIYMSISTHT